MLQSLSQGHKSSASQISKSTSQFLNDEELTDADLIKVVNEIKRQIRVVSLENEILERAITRNDPSLMHGIQQAFEYAIRMQSSSTLTASSFIKSQTSKFGIESFVSPSRMLTSPSKASTRRAESGKVSGIIFGSGPRINVLERSELVSTEMEFIVKSLEASRNKAAKDHALLKAQLEEIGIREVEIEKANEQFNNEVTEAGWDKIAQRIPAEIWIKYMNEWMKITDRQIGKLRLRTSTLNAFYHKLKGQIKTKAELSESLRAVDFEKLKIENRECLETINYKIQQLEELKKLTGDANLNLTVHKKALTKQNDYLKKVLDTIQDRERQTVVIDREIDAIQVQADEIDDKLNNVKRIREEYIVPDVMEYVKVKAEVAELKHTIKLLENRAHIQEIALASLNKKLRFIK